MSGKFLLNLNDPSVQFDEESGTLHVKVKRLPAPWPLWQPIETAPKDEDRCFLVCEQYGEDSVCYVAWYEPLYGGWIYTTQGSDDDFCVLEPTHWMPLPPPP